MPLLPFFHDKEDSEPLFLTDQEKYDLASDEEDYKNQKEYRDSKAQIWSWAGSVYNIIQAAQPDDRVSQIVIGWIRSYIDTGVAQMTAGEPDFDYMALGPSDHARTMLWKEMVRTAMSRSNFGSHQTIAMTDSATFGPGVMEVYQRRPFRTIREPQLDGTFKDRVIVDHRIPRVGARAISPFRCTRNPNVSDPNEVGSCTKEEILSWNQFVQNYGRVLDDTGKSKYKNVDQIPKGSHVKVTVYQDEIRDVYRIYAMSYGSKNDGETDIPPEGLGIPIFDRPLKIHNLYGTDGELLQSMGLNLPGMCNLVFFPYSDKLNKDYETHCLYGMGLPEQMEGLDMFMQTAFNMTIDNFRMGNTMVLNYKSNDGTIPDFDANTYYGGEFVNAEVSAVPLGQDRTGNFQQMYETIQNIAIPGTGININMIEGEPARTKFEFEQRIEANNQRTERRLKDWENGPLKRLGTLLLSGCLSELTTHELENIQEKDAKSILKDIDLGRATVDDFEFEGGKPAKRKVRYYIDVKGWKEDFSNGKKSRKLDVDSVENTLVPDKENPNAIHKVAITEELVNPDWYVESGVLFDTLVDSKRMITNRKIKDAQGVSSVLQNVLALLQADPALGQRINTDVFLKEIVDFADMNDDVIKKEDEGETEKLLKQITDMKQQVLTPPLNAPQAPPMSQTTQTSMGAGPMPPGPLGVPVQAA
jgi:hypothetical protein